jgi:hypothetical protein
MANNAVRLPFIGRVIYTFHAQLDGELSLTKGDLVLVTKSFSFLSIQSSFVFKLTIAFLI